MTNQVSHHPDPALLQEFYEGTLAIGFNLIISAHVDDCDICRKRLAELAESTCNDWYDEHPSANLDDSEFADILSDIVDQAVPGSGAMLQEAAASEGPLETVQLKDRAVKIPHALRQFATTEIRWKEIARGIHQSLLDVDPTTKCEIIFMDPGAEVPRHTHMGQEVMLVLDGVISDEKASYGSADFVISDQNVHHRQQTEEGCVCLFVTDAPLEFTEGLARLLNPINRAKFWWASRNSPRAA